ncbi:hypothetical protein FMUAM8_48710 [Nocardia cyriacigeorgica]|nr:hypothetical protein FMUAM8_48710 [Nocardia cyriacigeorgica]
MDFAPSTTTVTVLRFTIAMAAPTIKIISSAAIAVYNNGDRDELILANGDMVTGR